MLTTLFASFENELTIFIKYLTLKRELNVSIKVFLNVVVVLLFVLPREDNDGYSFTFYVFFIFLGNLHIDIHAALV